MRFSTARTTPSLVFTPIAVEPNYKKHKNYLTNSEIQTNTHTQTIIKKATNRWHSNQHNYNLNSLNGIFDLKQPAFRGESIDSSIILGPTISKHKTRKEKKNPIIITIIKHQKPHRNPKISSSFTL